MTNSLPIRLENKFIKRVVLLLLCAFFSGCSLCESSDDGNKKVVTIIANRPLGFDAAVPGTQWVATNIFLNNDVGDITLKVLEDTLDMCGTSTVNNPSSVTVDMSVKDSKYIASGSFIQYTNLVLQKNDLVTFSVPSIEVFLEDCGSPPAEVGVASYDACKNGSEVVDTSSGKTYRLAGDEGDFYLVDFGFMSKKIYHNMISTSSYGFPNQDNDQLNTGVFSGYYMVSGRSSAMPELTDDQVKVITNAVYQYESNDASEIKEAIKIYWCNYDAYPDMSSLPRPDGKSMNIDALEWASYCGKVVRYFEQDSSVLSCDAWASAGEGKPRDGFKLWNPGVGNGLGVMAGILQDRCSISLGSSGSGSGAYEVKNQYIFGMTPYCAYLDGGSYVPLEYIAGVDDWTNYFRRNADGQWEYPLDIPLKMKPTVGKCHIGIANKKVVPGVSGSISVIVTKNCPYKDNLYAAVFPNGISGQSVKTKPGDAGTVLINRDSVGDEVKLSASSFGGSGWLYFGVAGDAMHDGVTGYVKFEAKVPDINPNSSISQTTLECKRILDNALYGPLNADGSRSNGVATIVYDRLVKSSSIKNTILIVCALSIIAQSASYIGGSHVESYKVVIKAAKICLIAVLFTDKGYEFFIKFFFTFFIGGVSEVIGYITVNSYETTGPITGFTYNPDMDPSWTGPGPDKSLVGQNTWDFKFLDYTLGRFFEGKTWYKLAALFFSGPIGWLAGFMILQSTFIFMISSIHAILAMFTCSVATAMLVGIFPIILPCILFDYSMKIFHNYVRLLINYFVTPVFIFVSMYLLINIIRGVIDSVFGFGVCSGCVAILRLSSDYLRLCLAYVPLPAGFSASQTIESKIANSGNPDFGLLGLPVPLSAILSYCLLASIMRKFVSMAGDIANQTVGIASSSIGGFAGVANSIQDDFLFFVGLDRAGARTQAAVIKKAIKDDIENVSSVTARIDRSPNSYGDSDSAPRSLMSDRTMTGNDTGIGPSAMADSARRLASGISPTPGGDSGQQAVSPQAPRVSGISPTPGGDSGQQAVSPQAPRVQSISPTPGGYSNQEGVSPQAPRVQSISPTPGGDSNQEGVSPQAPRVQSISPIPGGDSNQEGVSPQAPRVQSISPIPGGDSSNNAADSDASDRVRENRNNMLRDLRKRGSLSDQNKGSVRRSGADDKGDKIGGGEDNDNSSEV